MPSGFIFVIIALCAILLGAHAAVHAFLVRTFSLSSAASLWLRIVFGALVAGFIGSFLLIQNYNSLFTRILYTVSAAWIGFLLYFLIAAAIFYLALVAGKTFISYPAILLVGKLFALAAVATGIYGVWHGEQLRVTEVTVQLPNLPDSWKGRTAVFYADMHLGQIHGAGFAQRVADKVQSLNPDIIFDGGDLYDGPKVDEREIIKPLTALRPPLGYYFVTGNHEEYGNKGGFLDAIKNAGIRALHDEAIMVDGLQIVGVNYDTTAGKEGFAKVLEAISRDASAPTILMKHVPFDLDVSQQNGIALQLSGHTHRAQVWPLMYITRAVYKGYDYGFKKYGNMDVLVTDGVGSWGPPLRVGTNAEIVRITFE
jgi:predicted MPP superfamily phosphohydrolase